MSDQSAVVPAETGGATKPIPGTGALNLQQAVAKVLAERQSARAAAVAPPVPRPDPSAGAEETTQPEGEQPGQESAEAEGVDEAQSQETDEQAETEDQGAGGEAIELSEDTLITLPNGEVWKVADLQPGLMKAKDYTKKTQVVAQREQAVEGFVRQFADKASVYEQELRARDEQARQALENARAYEDRATQEVKRLTEAQRSRISQWEKVDWERLGQEQPGRVVALWTQYQQEKQQLETAEADVIQRENEAKEQAKKQQEQAQEEYARAWLGGRQQLLEHLKTAHPQLADPQQSNIEWGFISNTLRSVGMPEEVIKAAFGARHDHRVPLVSPPMFEIIRKAALYDAAVAQHSKATSTGKSKANGEQKIRIVKAEGARTFRPPPADKAAIGRAHAKFNQTGSLKDGVAFELAKMRSRGRR